MENQTKINNKLLTVAFAMYLFLLIWAIALKFNAEWLPELGEYLRESPLYERVGNNIIPFYNMIKKGFYFNLDYFMNVIIYIPLGIYLLIIANHKNKYLITFFITMLSSIAFELIQLVTGFGGCDGTDFVCNCIGGIIGMFIYFLINKMRNSSKIVNIVNLIVVICFTPLAIYAFINTITNLHLYKL